MAKRCALTAPKFYFYSNASKLHYFKAIAWYLDKLILYLETLQDILEALNTFSKELLQVLSEEEPDLTPVLKPTLVAG